MREVQDGRIDCRPSTAEFYNASASYEALRDQGRVSTPESNTIANTVREAQSRVNSADCLFEYSCKKKSVSKDQPTVRKLRADWATKTNRKT